MTVAIVFDLDGTLIDSAPDLHEAALRTLRDHALPPIRFEQTRSFIGNGVPRLVARILSAVGLPEDPGRHAVMTDDFHRHYAAASTEKTRVYPGVKGALSLLAAAGHKMAVCTNKPEAPARHVIRHFGLSPHFEIVVGGDTLPVKKPDPAPLRHAFAQLGAQGGLYVGDSEIDSATAVAADIPFMLFTEGYRKTPTAEIAHRAAFSSYADLPVQVAKNI